MNTSKNDKNRDEKKEGNNSVSIPGKLETDIIISTKTINIIKDIVFNRDTEVCANLRHKSNFSNKLSLMNIVEGKVEEYAPGKYRGTCNHEMITSVMFHSHPTNSYAYPSVEDILNVVKNHGKIKRSIIATKWGLWDIRNTEISNIYSSTCKYSFSKHIGYFLDRIGRYTSNRESSKRDTATRHKSIDVTKNDKESVINDNISYIENFLNIKIDLYLWEELEGELILKK